MFTNKDKIKIFYGDNPCNFEREVNHYLETNLEDRTILTPIKIFYNPEATGSAYRYVMICKKESVATYDFINNITIEE